MDTSKQDRRWKVVLGFGCVMIVVAVMVSGLIIWSQGAQGFFGSWIGVMVGLMTSPVILESTLFVVGLLLVIGFNWWRRKKEGDEYVTIEVDRQMDLRKEEEQQKGEK